MKYCKVQTGCQLSSPFNLTPVTVTSSMECRDCQGKHQVDVLLHFFFPSSLILLTEGFCMTCFQQRPVTGFTEKSLLWTRKQTQFPHGTYSCQDKGHTPNTLNGDAGSSLRPWTLLLSLHWMKRTSSPWIYRDFPDIDRVAWRFHHQKCSAHPNSLI